MVRVAINAEHHARCSHLTDTIGDLGIPWSPSGRSEGVDGNDARIPEPEGTTMPDREQSPWARRRAERKAEHAEFMDRLLQPEPEPTLISAMSDIAASLRSIRWAALVAVWLLIAAMVIGALAGLGSAAG